MGIPLQFLVQGLGRFGGGSVRLILILRREPLDMTEIVIIVEFARSCFPFWLRRSRAGPG